jgi:pimeloyl-ACP methyl ester carboxylesterase
MAAPFELSLRAMSMVTTSPRLRRAYFESRHGQLHVHNAIPAGGGFDEQTTLICLHSSSSTGRVFHEFSRIVGETRSVYSPDTPGCGESDGPAEALSIAGYAAAIGDFLDSMRFRQVDLLGAHSGAAVAAELAIARPKQVRKVVMIGAPLLDAAEKKHFREQPAQPGTPQGASWARSAVIDWDGATRLGLVTQPLLVFRPKDNFWEAGARVKSAAPRAEVVELAEHGKDVLEKEPRLIAERVLKFF